MAGRSTRCERKVGEGLEVNVFDGAANEMARRRRSLEKSGEDENKKGV